MDTPDTTPEVGCTIFLKTEFPGLDPLSGPNYEIAFPAQIVKTEDGTPAREDINGPNHTHKEPPAPHVVSLAQIKNAFDDGDCNQAYPLQSNVEIERKVPVQSLEFENIRENGDVPYNSAVNTRNISPQYHPIVATEKGEEKYQPAFERGEKGSQQSHDDHQQTIEKPFSCSSCSAAFTRRRDLARHVLSVHNRTHASSRCSCNRCESQAPKPFICRHCDAAFSRNSCLNRHVILVHSGEKPFRCIHCSTSFSKNDQLQRHIVSQHGPQFRCTHCPASYRKMNELTKHMVEHTGEKPCSSIVLVAKAHDSAPFNPVRHLDTNQDRTEIIPTGLPCVMNELDSVAEVGETVFLKYELMPGDQQSPFDSVSANLTSQLLRSEGGNPSCEDTTLVTKFFSPSTVSLPSTKPEIDRDDSQEDSSVPTILEVKEDPAKDPLEIENVCRTDHGRQNFEEGFCSPSRYFPTSANDGGSPASRILVEFQQTGKEPLSESHCYAPNAENNNSRQQMSKIISGEPFISNDFFVPVTSVSHPVEKSFTCNDSSTSLAQPTHSTAHMHTPRGEEPFKCSHCSASFARRSLLEKHLCKQTGAKPFSCSYCSASFAGRRLLEKHVCKQTGAKPFNDSHRFPSFTQNTELTAQVRTHTREKPYSCSHCPASFAEKEALSNHLRGHAVEEPVSCNKCSACLARRPLLEKHLCKQTGAKPFNGSHCFPPFTQNTELTALSKKSFTCNDSSTSLAKSTHLTDHMNTPTGEKPYSCSHCPASFAEKEALSNRLRVHAVEEPVSCNKCSACFARRTLLEKNLCKQTGAKPFNDSQCFPSFTRNTELTGQMRTHTSEESSRCSNRSTSFSEKINSNSLLEATQLLKSEVRTPSNEETTLPRPLVTSLKPEVGGNDDRKDQLLSSVLNLKEEPPEDPLDLENVRHNNDGGVNVEGEFCNPSHHLPTVASYGKGNIYRILNKPQQTSEKPSNESHSYALYAEKIIPEQPKSKITDKKTFKCGDCSMSFKCKSRLLLHMPKHTGEKAFKCNLCPAALSSKHQLKIHMFRHTGERPFKCCHCPASFIRRVPLIDHLRQHTGERPFSCSVCSASFTGKHALQKHARRHTTEKSFSCSHCSKSFICKYELIKHTRKHTGEKPFSCDQCAAAFTQQASLKQHMFKHNGDKPLKCNDCSKSFCFKSTLIIHTRTHTGEKPFSCDRCSLSFHERSALKQHAHLHTGQKPFSCNRCSASFSTRSNLKSHMVTHSDEKRYKCNDCSASFKRRMGIIEHTRKHTGERPFRCSYCSASFIARGYLKWHMKRHTGEKLFSCSHCLSSFSRKSLLKEHIMRQHIC